jgi:hypothetical protein
VKYEQAFYIPEDDILEVPEMSDTGKDQNFMTTKQEVRETR